MSYYIPRSAEKSILYLTTRYPAVVLVGPRQVGKTSLVKKLTHQLPKEVIYLDLEYPEDLNKLVNPALFLETLQAETVIIDEVQRMPTLFPVLRALIDRKREAGRFILLGSASPELIRDTSESLAGRVAYFELPPLILEELPEAIDFKKHWLRGGFPESLLAQSDQDSLEWRFNFIQSYLERDLPLLGLGADPQLIRRLWTMIAHINSNILNMQTLAKSLGVTSQSIKRYLDFLESAFLIRRLAPYHFNIKKRLIKSPKIYIRDTGIQHALLNIKNFEQLLGNPSLGGSWEAYILQEVSARLTSRSELYFYRTQDGTEADLVITSAGVPKCLIEMKFSTTPKVARGFHTAIQDLKTNENYIICPIEKGYPISEDVKVLGIQELDRLMEVV